ncbi:unnamed protein product [Kuraishia capsulata CBS 1993]|uniref:Uncharacterized protein n=1 Tax=Kuraishia capsulata CBS 1993 TaxID=1382522 RepID=W6MK11_9ASCO|nr:uncharacterized protein KUCA_T00002858001 [Kuraishia capsulata CBS 1993]CDK26884.1 unnamed protein product [Kuraishia capsulata CBS 1993]
MLDKQNNSQPSTPTTETPSKILFGAEKEQQIMNEIRASKPGYREVFESSVGGGYFNLAFKKSS